MFKKLGPGILVAAAFIGPGTVTACTLAGVGFGYSLLWAMIVSILATMVLQEMASRVGSVSKQGLAEVMRGQFNNKVVRMLVLTVVLLAIVGGNIAYEGGNIGGGTLGLQALLGEQHTAYFPWVIAAIAFALLFIGSYKLLERVFVALVGLMSLAFLITAVLTGPELMALIEGMFLPKITDANLLTVIALVGTTVVPYNLFLHAALVNEKWEKTSDLKYARWDTFISIALGAVVSMAIIIAAAAIPASEVNSALDLAKALEPLFGSSSRYFMGIGLFAAGITSAITAPLAAAYVANSCFGWKTSIKDWRFRAVWMLVLFAGLLSLSFDFKPIEIIKMAQIANGTLLPVVAILLLFMVNKAGVMKGYGNTKLQNLIGGLIVLFTLFLGVRTIMKVLGAF